MPQLDVLPNARSEHVTLGPIMESESTVAGNYNVMENIYVQQFNLNKELDFSDRLCLVVGDQKQTWAWITRVVPVTLSDKYPI